MNTMKAKRKENKKQVSFYYFFSRIEKNANYEAKAIMVTDFYSDEKKMKRKLFSAHKNTNA